MKTTSKYNKSQIRKRAWNIYKGNNPYSYSFSAALRRAWEVEKAMIKYNEREAKRAAIEAENAAAKAKRISNAWTIGCLDYYQNARPGQYFGD
ncbi:hypothetical protein [Alistipes indistinctus]|jgi:hypothetical protein|uniref:hypothetical protein n=1 Tax=Alistipes indistinctus TaxID=626932 RepID=UPI003F004B66